MSADVQQTAGSFEVKETNTLKDMFENMVNGIERDRARMPEGVFVSVFLPFFAGEALPTPQSNAETWINIAGSPFREVDIIDDAGEVVMTIPPFYDRSNIGLYDRTNGGVSAVMSNALLLASNFQSQADQHVVNTLAPREHELLLGKNTAPNNVNRWNAILRHYGKPPLTPVDFSGSNDDSAAAAQTVQAEDPALGWDPM